MKVLAKLRRGVVAIATPDECVYADPTLLQRFYLLWTFRNFRRLSVRVLNDRQRKIVERLAEVAHRAETKRVNAELVIGRAEFARLPAPKPLEWITAPQIGDEPLPGLRKRARYNLHQLATYPRALTERAAQALTQRPKQIRSHSRYSLVLTFSLASLVLISGAVAQRLWTNHTKLVSTSLSLPAAEPPRAVVPNEIQRLSVAVPIPTAPNDSVAKPAALRLSPRATSAASSKVKTVRPEPMRPDGAISNAEEIATSSRLRVSLAPHTVIYPSIPNSGSSGNGKKQILVKALVNANGTVDDVQVPGQSPSLATAVAKTIKQWRFQPYLLNGQPVEVETRMIFTVLGPDAITVRFLLANESPGND